MSNDYNNKRYYWIKLKDTFFTSDTVDFLMSQKDGANYVVLYQMLCLKTANTNGELSRQIGEIIIPFDIDKISRDCKYFNVDTIRVALELYKKLGLIYEQENGILQITNFNNIVGSESQNAIYKRQQRELESVQQMSNKILDNRYKILDNRYKILDNKEKEINKEKVRHKYGEFGRILLTEKEYEKLICEFGKNKIDEQIKLLDEYVESNNNKNKYTNFNLVIRKSIRDNWFNNKKGESNEKCNSRPVRRPYSGYQLQPSRRVQDG